MSTLSLHLNLVELTQVTKIVAIIAFKLLGKDEKV